VRGFLERSTIWVQNDEGPRRSGGFAFRSRRTAARWPRLVRPCCTRSIVRGRTRRRSCRTPCPYTWARSGTRSHVRFLRRSCKSAGCSSVPLSWCAPILLDRLGVVKSNIQSEGEAGDLSMEIAWSLAGQAPHGVAITRQHSHGGGKDQSFMSKSIVAITGGDQLIRTVRASRPQVP